VDKREQVLKIANAALRFRPPEVKGQAKPGGNGAARTAQGPTAGGGAPGLRIDRKAGGEQTIWVFGDDKRPRPVTVKLGITDGSFSEVVEGDLREGQELIIGLGSKEGSATGGQTQPFGQRGPRF